jgi:xanthine dehydrogenase YagR molybdenum-binding subunit
VSIERPVGVGPAIANAVYHATGVRVRELPIRPEALLAGRERG